MYILYDDYAGWERSFLLQELFGTLPGLPGATAFQVRFVESGRLADRGVYPPDAAGNNIFVFSSNVHSFPEIEGIAAFLRPRIIVHLSDEAGDRPSFQQLSTLTPLVLRQYYHRSYDHPPNVRYIPLGYMDKFFGDDCPSTEMTRNRKSPAERAYVWSFIGALKHDRRQMIQTMKQLMPHFFGKASVPEMYRLYSDSIFVPNGRGNVTLDCFRLYEAATCGAIPIVVGDPSETGATFSREDNPPWVFASSWTEAIAQVSFLLREREMLVEKQRLLYEWWLTRIRNIQAAILTVLQD